MAETDLLVTAIRSSAAIVAHDQERRRSIIGLNDRSLVADALIAADYSFAT